MKKRMKIRYFARLGLAIFLFLQPALSFLPGGQAFAQARPVAGPVTNPDLARQAGPVAHPATALDKVLNPDGSLNLNTSANGSFDASGWSLSTATDGSPRFERAGAEADLSAHLAPQLAGDVFWDQRFFNGVITPGFASQVHAIAISGSDVFFGGSFTQAGGITANNIARWSTVTHQWYALAGGLSGTVFSMIASGTNLYVGGSFNDLDGKSAWSLGRWDTVAQTWSLVGGSPGLSSSGGKFVGNAYALALDGSGNLYVAGSFDSAGGVPACNVAKLAGSVWSALGSGLGVCSQEVVRALAVSGSDVFAGGLFTNPYSSIALWNGTNWSSLGGINGVVYALALNGNALYVGGQFTQADSTLVSNIAIWTPGNNWLALGSGTENVVTSITLGPGGYFVGGTFLTAGGVTVNHVALWSGSGWSALDSGVDNEVDSLAVIGNNVFVGGSFLNANVSPNTKTVGPTNAIGVWNTTSQTWHTLGNSLDWRALVVAISGSDVYFGGSFTTAGGVQVNNIARWNRATGAWSDLGGGVTGCSGGQICLTDVFAIAINGPDVYVGGNFSKAGDVQAYDVARWNTLTNTWTGGMLGVKDEICGPDNNYCYSAVYAIVPHGSGVDVGGNFYQTACLPVCTVVNNVVYWDGNKTYIPFSDGSTVGTDGDVYTLFYDGSGTYVGGSYTSPRTNLAYFDGVSWYGVGNPLNSSVETLTEDGQYLYAGGNFDNAGNSGANKIARLSITSPGDWQPMGNSLNGQVETLAWNGSDLIAGGLFTVSGLAGLSHIARWNTSTQTWAPIGSGANSTVAGLAATANEIYAVGLFSTMGDKESEYLAHWANFSSFLPFVER